MATRTDFTEEQWTAMQSGITGAGFYVATVDRGFFDTFKEANALAHHLREAHERSDSKLIRELAAGHDRPFGVDSVPAGDRAEHGHGTPAGCRSPRGEVPGRSS